MSLCCHQQLRIVKRHTGASAGSDEAAGLSQGETQLIQEQEGKDMPMYVAAHLLCAGSVGVPHRRHIHTILGACQACGSLAADQVVLEVCIAQGIRSPDNVNVLVGKGLGKPSRCSCGPHQAGTPQLCLRV